MTVSSRTTYFQEQPDAPPPLEAECSRRVRFEEVDPLNIVWHGRYPGYFEDGRCAFGDKYALRYQDMFQHQFIAPIVQMHIDYQVKRVELYKSIKLMVQNYILNLIQRKEQETSNQRLNRMLYCHAACRSKRLCQPHRLA